MFEDFEFCSRRDELENSDFELCDISEYLSDDEPELEPPAPLLTNTNLAAWSGGLDYFTGALADIRAMDTEQAA